MRTILRLLLVVMVIGLVASVAALVAGVGRPEDRPPLRFDPDPFVVPAMIEWPGELDFDVSVVNDSDEPAQIVGAESFCAAGCFYGLGLPVTIPARGRGSVILRVGKDKPGPISANLDFFTDRPSQPRLTMRIKGFVASVALHATSPPTPVP